jgi:hypothetical protein
VQVAGLDEPSDGGPRTRRRQVGDLQGGGGLDLHHPQARVGDPADGARRVGERHGQVARVQADPDELGVDPPVLGPLGPGARGEPRDDVLHRVQHAPRLGLDGDAHRPAGAPPQLAQLRGQRGEGLGRLVVVGACPRRAPRQGQRGDRAGRRLAVGAAVGQQLREHPCAREHVVEADALGPGGRVHRELDHLAVEAAVREGVQGVHLEPVLRERRAQPRAVLR